MTALRESLLIAAVLAVGLIAGLFCAFAYAVMPGLAQTDDPVFVSSMQRINVVIVNPLFLLLFFGGLVFTTAAAVFYRGEPIFWWIVAGAVTYVVGLLITMVVNVPLNNDLAAIGGPSSIADPAAARAAFENVWVRWNLIRAVVHTVAFAALLVGLVTR
ncbi:anthrone oxygenase family protein [Williamsia muralis]|uniref:DUF1772 domain-containing protein n=1 Tax=Williamsia marianensis TaxID=85044 RepID=A0A2G3PR00_WILMA|nr:anthrone oxygenase family protein [Williamsia marianensis]PHV68224.1 hypothetical protein CSW57_02985 [Williamsia marianensis]